MIGLERLVSLPTIPVSAATGVTSGHVIVITFVLRSKQTNIHIDIKDVEGGVRATSILCLLGIGVGLGSLLIYKIYSKLFSPAIAAPPQQPQRKLLKCHHCGHGYGDHGNKAGLTCGNISQNDAGYCTDAKKEGDATTDTSASTTPSTPSTACLLDTSEPVEFTPQGKPSSTPVCPPAGQSDRRVRYRGRSHCRTDSTGSEGFMLLPPGVNHSSMYSSFSSDLGFSSGVPPDSLETLHSGSEGSFRGHLREFHPNWYQGTSEVFTDFYKYNQTVDEKSHAADGLPPQNYSRSRRRHLSSASVPEVTGDAHQPRFGAKSDMDLFDNADIGCRGYRGVSSHSSPAHSNRSSSDKSSRKRAAPDDDSDEEDQVFLKRQPLSFCSDLTAYSDISTRDYLLCRYSVDLGENLSGYCTPDPNLLDKEEIGQGTVSNIELIQRELSGIQQDINEMTHDVFLLRSRENLLELDDADVDGNLNCLYDSLDINSNPSHNSSGSRTSRMSPFRAISRSRSRSRSLSCTRSLSPCDSMRSHDSDPSDLRQSSQSFGDFMWDYQSDLLANTIQTPRGTSRGFVAKRPRISKEGVVVQADSDTSGSRNSCDTAHVSWEVGGCKPQKESAPSRPTALNCWRVDNVGQRYNMFEYAERRWRDGSCCESKAMKEGFHRLPSLLGLSHLRQVRRDHYCPLRATLFQSLVNNLPLQKHLGSWQEIHKRLDVFQRYGYLQHWTFGNRLPYSRGCLYEKVVECVKCLYDQMKYISNIEDQPSREEYLVQQLNTNPELDLHLMEGCKILMMLHAIRLHEKLLSGHGVPLFLRLLYGAEGVTTPELILKNLLNPLGDIRGMQKLEMFLLGHTLGVKIEVIRPMRCRHDDYIAHYPDDGADAYPKVYLVEEDEGHFNVLCH